MTAAHPELVVRNLRFQLAEVPRDWIPDRPGVARFLDQLSLVFPRGERLFMESVRVFEPRLGRASQAKLRGFVQQEAMHAREHAAHNHRLAAQGYPVHVVDANVAAEVAHIQRWPARRRLAYTCAIEHFTAILGQRLLEDDGLLEGAHPTMAAMWRWHAAEENEHASVAFDIYQEVGGTYLERTLVMLYATFRFWGLVALDVPRMQRVDDKPASWAAYGQLARLLWGRRGIMRRSLGAYLAYLRPRFHPHDLDVSAALARWRERFEPSIYPSPQAAAE